MSASPNTRGTASKAVTGPSVAQDLLERSRGAARSGRGWPRYGPGRRRTCARALGRHSRASSALTRSSDQNDSDEAKAREFVAALYNNVPVLDSGARGSTTTFVQRRIGDVLIAWENEALLAIKELGPDQVELVVPSVSILAEPPVAVLTRIAEANGTKEVATAYLEYLYSPLGQKLAVKHYYRPSKPELVDAEALSSSRT